MSVPNPRNEQARLEALRSHGILDTEAIVPCVGENGKPRKYVAIGTDIADRREAAKVRRCLAAVVESSDDAIISETLDGTITTWNFGAEKLFGYSSSEAVGKHVRMLLAPERATEEADTVARIEHGERVDHFETLRVRKDGKTIDVSATISPIKDSGGAIVGASTIARDITERRRVEKALCESEEGFQAMANGIQQLAWIAETDGSVSWYNQRWYEYTGTTLKQVQGWGWQSVHDPEVLPKVLEEWKGAIAAGKPLNMEFPLRGADGHFRMFLTCVMPVRDSQGHVVRWLGTNTDISERKQAEGRLARKLMQLGRQRNEMLRSRKALQDQTALLQSFLNSTAEGFIAADEGGQFTLWNPAAEKLLGLGAANIPSEEWTAHYGLFLSDMQTPFPADQFPLARAIRGESSTVELFVRNPKVAEGIWMDATGHPLKGTDGLYHGGVVVFRDITQRKTAEHTMQTLNQTLERRVAERTAQLEEARRELESFTYSVAHDLRAPLRHIAGYSGILVEDFSSSLDPQVQRYLQRIQEGTRRMGQLVDELLSLAQVSRKEPNLQRVGLNSMIEKVIDVLQPETKGREVEWRIADLSFIECDPALIRQAFQHLISNALKYSRPRALAVIEIGRIRENGHLTFFVRDNGVGFNMKYANKLFGVFQRLHRLEDFEGIGVGLATVQRIIKKHAGLVWAEAQLDKGATFYFTIGGQPTAATKEQTILAGV